MIEERRVAAMTISKIVFLRINIERILLQEVLNQNKDMRQPPDITNAIERYLNLSRLKTKIKHKLNEKKVRDLVAQIEALYCFSLCKSIIMS